MLKPGEPPRQVLEKVAQLSKWGAPLATGHAHGVALGQYDDAWVATVAEVSIASGKLTVHKLTVAVDVGQPVNLETLDQQIPSAAIYAMSAALRGKITFKDGVPLQKNFPDYPVVHMENSPEFVIDIARATRPSTGAGEVGVPTTAPAITNAIFALTGKRIRSLPISDALS